MLSTRSGRNASQAENELASFVNLLRTESVSSYLEIGARHGDTFFHVIRHANIGCGLAVDLGGGAWGTPKSVKALRNAVTELVRLKHIAMYHLGDSTSDETVNYVDHFAKKYTPNGVFDAIFIDGDHRYEGVKRDWEIYGPRSRIVAFHDINGDGQKSGDGLPVEVPRLWAEIKQSGKTTVEFIDPDYRMGIGVVFQ